SYGRCWNSSLGNREVNRRSAWNASGQNYPSLLCSIEFSMRRRVVERPPFGECSGRRNLNAYTQKEEMDDMSEVDVPAPVEALWREIVASIRAKVEEHNARFRGADREFQVGFSRGERVVIVLTEQRGKCITKHALIRRLALSW